MTRHNDLALLALLPLQPALVEFQLLAFENVSVTSSALSWAGRDAGQEPASCELIINLQNTAHTQTLKVVPLGHPGESA